MLFLGGPWHGQLHVVPGLWHTYRALHTRSDGGPGYRCEVLYGLRWFVPPARLGLGQPRFPTYVFGTYCGPARWR